MELLVMLPPAEAGEIGGSPPPKSTRACPSKFWFCPLIVSVNAGPPASTLVGLMDEITSEAIGNETEVEFVFELNRSAGLLATQICAVPVAASRFGFAVRIDATNCVGVGSCPGVCNGST